MQHAIKILSSAYLVFGKSPVFDMVSYFKATVFGGELKKPAKNPVLPSVP